MAEPHIAVAETEEGYFLVAGADLPSLSPDKAEAVGNRGTAAYAEAGLAVAKEVCRDHGMTLILRAAVRDGDAQARLLISVLSPERRTEEVRTTLDQCLARLSRWGAAGLDRPALDGELNAPPDPEAVRYAKQDAWCRSPHAEVPLLSGTNAAVRFDRPAVGGADVVVDWGIFPVEGDDVGDSLRRTAVAGRVLATRLPRSATELEQNSEQATIAADQKLYLGTAITVVRSVGAPDICGPFTAPSGKPGHEIDWKLTPEDEVPGEELAFQVLDYQDERARRASLEPDVRAVFEAHAGLTSGGAAAPADIFISYPRKRMAWVEQNIYEPLRRRGGWSIFFDRDSIDVGSVWSARLATGANDCRVFLPVFCEEYWQSAFCKWEWGIAFRRDPSGEQGLIVPVLLDGSSLPAECAHVQAADVRRPDFREILLSALAARLD